MSTLLKVSLYAYILYFRRWNLRTNIPRPVNADIHSQIIALESLDKWAEARKLMDTAGDVDVEVRAAAKFMSEGRPSLAYEVLRNRVPLFDVPGFRCGKISGRIYMMRETLKNIEKFRAKSGPEK